MFFLSSSANHIFDIKSIILIDSTYVASQVIINWVQFIFLSSRLITMNFFKIKLKKGWYKLNSRREKRKLIKL
jgi:hypothetical protein